MEYSAGRKRGSEITDREVCECTEELPSVRQWAYPRDHHHRQTTVGQQTVRTHQERRAEWEDHPGGKQQE